MKEIERGVEDDKGDLLDTIRAQAKDLDFLNAVVSMMLKDEEMYKLKEKIEYDFDAQKWKVPPFVVKAREVAFPKIKNAATFAKNSLEERDLVWQNNE